MDNEMCDACGRHDENSNSWRDLAGRPEGKSPLERLKVRPKKSGMIPCGVYFQEHTASYPRTSLMKP